MFDKPSRRSSRFNRQSPKDNHNGPDRGFKSVRRQRERAQVKQAIRDSHFEGVPTFKKSDKYDWF